MAGVPYHAVEQYLAKLVKLGRIGGDLRADRRSGHQQRPGRAQGDAHRHAGHADRRRPARRASATACCSRCMRRSRAPASRGSISRRGGCTFADVPLAEARQRRSSACTRRDPARRGRRRRSSRGGAPVHALAAVALRSRHRRARACARQFGTRDLAGFGADDAPLALGAAGALLDYARRTQRRRSRTCARSRVERASESWRSTPPRGATSRSPRRCAASLRRRSSLLDTCATAGQPPAAHWLHHPAARRDGRRSAPRRDRGAGARRRDRADALREGAEARRSTSSASLRASRCAAPARATSPGCATRSQRCPRSHEALAASCRAAARRRGRTRARRSTRVVGAARARDRRRARGRCCAKAA